MTKLDECKHICFYQTDCCNRSICVECDQDVTSFMLKRIWKGK